MCAVWVSSILKYICLSVAHRRNYVSRYRFFLAWQHRASVLEGNPRTRINDDEITYLFWRLTTPIYICRPKKIPFILLEYICQLCKCVRMLTDWMSEWMKSNEKNEKNLLDKTNEVLARFSIHAALEQILQRWERAGDWTMANEMYEPHNSPLCANPW